MVCSTPVSAVEVTDNLDLGGAIRARVDEDSTRGIHKFGIDTLMLSAKYTSDSWIGAARYRFYGKDYPYQYTRHFGDINFAEYAWIGYRFDPTQQVQVGLNQVPFGLQRLYSDTFLETLAFTMGLEDLDEIGAKYIKDIGDWNIQAGYYARPAWPGNGTSRGSTYSTVVTPADPYVAGGTDNIERDMFVGRLAKKVQAGEWKGEVGVSLLTSTLYNRDTRLDGRRDEFALHYMGSHGPWGVKLQYTRQVMSPKNPNGANQTITIGGYDGTYNMATRGNLYLANVSYSVPGSYLWGWITDVHPYLSYSLYDKTDPQFRNTQRWIAGTSFSLKFLSIYTEWRKGRNDPYLGGSSYAQSLAAGGIDHWRGQFFMNVAWYF
ncbi:hypothetical protein DWU99_17925 [Dyella psychrodurans]|uniref:Porin n=2 Tax=Dyella psychrodurans TaxID=1927960 RepID=A0A370WYD8_9GAMM|nr:hypothetical protein DWU99_17925 [Dyella psychrodurans]